MPDVIIQTKNLSVVYNAGKSNEVRSLRDVSTTIYGEEYVIIFGPSGCGKSTLLYSISGLQAASSGEVWVSGKELSAMSRTEKVMLHQFSIGMVFQAFYLISSLTVLENVCLPQVFCDQDKEARTQKGMELLQRFGIIEQASKYPNELSGGQKQRVAIARALINDPEIILADEPVGNLDSASSHTILNLLKELNEVDKKTIILVTHDPSHLPFADRILYMKDGELIREELNKNKQSPKEQEDIRKANVEKGKSPLEEQQEASKRAMDAFLPKGEKEKQLEPQDVIRKGDSLVPKGDTAGGSEELNTLLRSFRDLPREHISSLLVPFKAQHVLTHILSDLSEEQIEAAQGFARELLFESIDIATFRNYLDMDMSKGGASWNKQRAISVSDRMEKILAESRRMIEGDEASVVESLLEFFEQRFTFKMNDAQKERLTSILKLRLESKIDKKGLMQLLDAPWKSGGAGMNKIAAEKLSREMEILMLLKY